MDMLDFASINEATAKITKGLDGLFEAKKVYPPHDFEGFKVGDKVIDSNGREGIVFSLDDQYKSIMINFPEANGRHSSTSFTKYKNGKWATSARYGARNTVSIEKVK